MVTHEGIHDGPLGFGVDGYPCPNVAVAEGSLVLGQILLAKMEATKMFSDPLPMRDDRPPDKPA